MWNSQKTVIKSKNIMKQSILTILLLLVFEVSFSQTITGAAATLALDDMQTSISQVLTDAENAGNSLINNGAFQVNTTIYNFRATYKEALNTSDQFLTEQAYQIFLGIKKSSEKILQGATDFVADLENTVTTLHSVMASIPLISSKPIISKTELPVLIRNSKNDEYEIKFTGSLLNNGPRFKINGHKLIASEVSTKTLVYHLENQLLSEVMTSKRANIDLKFKYGGLFKKKSHFKYFLKVIPLEYAKIDAVVTTVTNDTIRIERVETLPATRTGGTNWRGKKKTSKETFTIYPTIPTNEILVNSASLQVIENRHGYGADIIAKSPASILIQQHARSDNKPLGGGGKVQSKVTFTELQITRKPGVQELKGMPLIFDDPLVIKLPNNATAVQKVVVTFYNGKTINLTTENKNKNFEVDFRILDKTLFIRNVKL
jgi:hypothetical protein